MEILQGFARNVHYVNSDIDAPQGASASRIGIFELEGQAVHLKIHDGILIEQGDQVIVAGERSGGFFKASAYHNTTKRVSGANFSILDLFLFVTFMLAGLATLNIIIGFAFIMIAVSILLICLRNWKAYKIVME